MADSDLTIWFNQMIESESALRASFVLTIMADLPPPELVS
jgi:hypothetical protein